MTLKERIINDFLNDPQRNFTIYGTDFRELSQMYDKAIGAIKSGEDFDRFLNFEGALSPEGYPKPDKVVDYERHLAGGKKESFPNTPVIFKYPVYKYFQSKYTSAIAEMKKKEQSIPLPTEH